MSEREGRIEGLTVALGVAYAEHMRLADVRDRAVSGTEERVAAQAALEASSRIVRGISSFIPHEPSGGETPNKNTPPTPIPQQ